MAGINSFIKNVDVAVTDAIFTDSEVHVEVVTVRDGRLICLCLLPGKTYSVTLVPTREVVQFRTLPSSLIRHMPEEALRTYISLHSHADPILISELILRCPSDYLWTDSIDVPFWERLFCWGLFALPHNVPSGDFVLIPNPSQKFCFDLSQPFIRNVTRRMRMDDFEFVVTTVSEGHGVDTLMSMLELCAEWHSAFGLSKSTWISNTFINAIAHMGKSSTVITFHTFQLVEKSSGRVASVSLGYRVGNAFMDFTACTPIRDRRSAGRLLTGLEGEWLKFHGVKLWYLGFKLGYMDSVSPNGVVLDRWSFQSLWDSASCIGIS